VRVACIAAVVLAGCAELPEVDSGVCGNHVLEVLYGEECDGVTGCGDAAGPNACGWVCDAQACPTGYACGADDRCRLPTETFVSTGAQQMATFAVSSSDMDGDGAGDLLGYDSRGLVMRFGDWEGELAAQTRVPLPLAGNAACTADVDGNGVRDLALPIAGFGFGLLIGDGARGVVPVAQSAISFLGAAKDGCEPILATSVPTHPTAEPRLILAIGGRDIAFLDDAGECMGQLDCLISVDGGEMLDGRISSATLGYGPLSGVHAGAQFTLGVAGQSSVSVWGESTSALRPERLVNYVLPGPLGPDGHVVFASLDADGCPDLVIDTGTQLRIAYSVTLGPACAGLSAALTTAVYPAGPLIGVGDTDGDGADELIAALYDDTDPGDPYWAIAAYAASGTPGQWSSRGLFASAERPLAVAVLDYDRDALPDLVVTTAGTSTVDFLLNYQGQGYSRFPVDVGGHPRVPQVGDFDGDLHADVVIAVPDEANPEGRDAVVILYGDPSGRPVGPQFLGSFVADAQPVPVDGGLQSFADSVIVVSNHLGEAEACDRRLAVLLGDTSRQLISPFVVTYDDAVQGTVAVTPLAIVDVSVEGGAPRTLALGLVPPPPASDEPPSVVISVLGFLDGEFVIDAGLQAKIPAELLPPSTLEGGRLVAGDLDGDGVAEVVAVAHDRAAVIHLDGEISAEQFMLEDRLADPPWIDLVDVDVDGDLDLVGAGGSRVISPDTDESAGPASLFWVIRNDGGELDVGDPDVLAMPADTFCFDAATIDSSPDGAPQLAALCYLGDTGTFGVAIGGYDAGGDEVSELRVIPVDGAPSQLEVADLTGDGLHDLALFTDTAVTIYRQCRTDEVCLAAEAL